MSAIQIEQSVSSGNIALRNLYATRGVIALIWAALLVIAGDGLGAPVVILLVLYPTIDILASLWEARQSPAGRIQGPQYVNLAVSLVAAVAILVAGLDDISSVLRVFGTWAVVTGAIQLLVALRRRPVLGNLWAMYISGAGSILVGILLVSMASSDDASLSSISGYATVGAIFFLISSAQLFFRERQLAKQP